MQLEMNNLKMLINKYIESIDEEIKVNEIEKDKFVKYEYLKGLSTGRDVELNHCKVILNCLLDYIGNEEDEYDDEISRHTS